MLRRKFLLLGGVTFCAALMFAQTLPPDLPPPHDGGIRSVDRSKSEVVERICHLQGREYRSLMSWQEAESSSGWDDSHPLLDSASCQLIRLLYSLPCKWQMRSTTSDLDRSTERMPPSCGGGRSGGSVWANMRAAQKVTPPRSRNLRLSIYSVYIWLSRLA